ASDINAVSVVEVGRANQNGFFTVFSREKALRKRRAFIRQGVLSGDDGEIPGPAAFFDVLFGKMAGDHATADNYVLKAGHPNIVLPIQHDNVSPFSGKTLYQAPHVMPPLDERR